MQVPLRGTSLGADGVDNADNQGNKVDKKVGSEAGMKENSKGLRLTTLEGRTIRQGRSAVKCLLITTVKW